MRILLTCVVLALALAAPAVARPAPADTVLWHGVVLTVDARDRETQGLAVRGGRIVAVGSDAAIRVYIGRRTRVIDLAGRTATPGLIDSHAHLLGGGLEELYSLSFKQTTSLSDLLAAVRARALAAAPGEWLRGAGWNEGLLAEHRAPSLAELDAAAAGHPVWLINATGHYGMADSAALAAAGIGDATASPGTGTIVRDAAGHATGVLKEDAQNLVMDRMPQPTPSQRQAALTHMIDEMHAEGMTGVKDPKLTAAEWEAYVELARAGGLSVHACALIYAGSDMQSARAALDEVRRARVEAAALPGHDLKVCGVKIFLDGSAIARTAWMNDDYPADAAHPAPTGRGYPTVDPATYRAMVRLFVGAGISVGTHVIGDRAIDTAADAYAEALKATPRYGLRLSLIHASEPSEHALAVMARLQKRYDSGIPEIQAPFLWWLGGLLPAAFTAEQARRVMPLETYAERGLIFTGGSDYPVTPLPSRYGLWASVARAPLNGGDDARPFGTAEAINIHQALRSYTAWSARQLFADVETGSLEAGKWADIAVWDRDPYSVATDDLKDMRCLMTFYKGRLVYRAPGA